MSQLKSAAEIAIGVCIIAIVEDKYSAGHLFDFEDMPPGAAEAKIVLAVVALIVGLIIIIQGMRHLLGLSDDDDDDPFPGAHSGGSG